MEQNQDLDNDLQQAINDITNGGNTEAVFSDPVAAPSKLPDDPEELGEPVGPFPDENVTIPPMPESGPMPKYEDVLDNAPDYIETKLSQPVDENAVDDTIKDGEGSLVETEADLARIKGDAIRNLIPVIDKTDLSADKKFGILKEAFEEFHDFSVLGPAQKAASAIADENDRAKALLFIIDSIDGQK